MMIWVVVFLKDFLCSPGDPWGFLIQFDHHIFQRGWFNHQLDEYTQVWGVFFASLFRCFFLKRPTEELMVDIFIR